jgi:hypothetical protein
MLDTHRPSRTWLVWLLGSAAGLLLIALAMYLLPLQPNVVALQLTYGPAAFQAVLDTWGPVGVQLFRSHLLPDGALLICYGAFGYLLTVRTRLFESQTSMRKVYLAWLMPVAALCDAVENALHWHLTALSKSAGHFWYTLAGLSATLKFGLVFAFMFSALLVRRR